MSLVAEPFRSAVRVLVLFLLAGLPSAVQAQPAGQLPLSDPRAFEGRWIASGYTCQGNRSDQVVEITYSVWSGLEARKIGGGTDCVRAGEIAWRNGKLIGRVIHAEFHVRKPGGSVWDSEWLTGSLQIISRDEIIGFGITFRRETPEEEEGDPNEPVVDLSGDWETRETAAPGFPAHPGKIRITQQGNQIVATWIEAPPVRELPYGQLGSERHYTGQEAFRGRIRGRQVVGTGVLTLLETMGRKPICNQGEFHLPGRVELEISEDGAALEGRLQSDQALEISADSENRPTGECRQITVGYEQGLSVAYHLAREGPPPPTAIRFSERIERGRFQRALTLVPGREFVVEAAYDRPPAADEVTATVEWEGSPATEIRLRRGSGSNRIYVSEPLVVLPVESESHPPAADEAAFLAGEWKVAHTDTGGTVVPGTAVVESPEGITTVRYRLGDPAQGEHRELTSRDVQVRGDYVEVRFAGPEASSGTAPSSSAAVIRIEAPAGTTVQASVRGVTTAATIGAAEPDAGVLVLRFPLPFSATPPERLTGDWRYATRGSGDDGARSGAGRESWTRVRRGTLASLRFIELDGNKAYEIDELLNGVPFYLEAAYQSPPSEAEAEARLTWEGGATSITLARDTLERYRSGPLVVPTEPAATPASSVPSPLELDVVGETLVTATLLDKQATARTQPAAAVAGISFRDHLGNMLPERVENGVLEPAQIQAGEPYVGVIEYASEPNQDEQTVTVAVRDQVSREKATRTEANAAVFETEPRRAVKVGDIVTLYAHGHANQLEVVPPRIEVFVRRPGQRHTRANVPSLTTDETFFVDVFVPPQEAVKIGDTLSVQLLAKEKGATASLQLRGQRSQRGPTIYSHDGPVTLEQGGAGESGSESIVGNLFSGRIDMTKLKSEKVDTLVVSYGDAKAEVPVYWSWRQRQLAEIATAMEALRQFYSAGLQNPNVTPAAKEQLHKRLNLIKNYDQVMAYEGEDFDDIRRLIAARGYFDMLQMDPAAWDPDYIPTNWAGTRNNRFGVLIGSRMEGEMLNRLEDGARQEYFDRFARTMRDATIGLYQVVANASGVNQLRILTVGTDAMGRSVDRTGKLMAGIDLVSQAAMQGAVVLRGWQVARQGAGGTNRARIVTELRNDMPKNVASDLILYGGGATRVPGPRPDPGFRGRSTDTVPESGAGPPPRDFRSAPAEAATASPARPRPADPETPGGATTTRLEPPPGSRPTATDAGSTSRIEPPPGSPRPNADPEGTTILDSPRRSPRPADGDTGLTSRIEEASGSQRPSVDPEGTTILDSPRRSPRPADGDTGLTSRIEDLKQLNEGQQRAIVTLFDDMARAGLVWEDGGPANIFLRQLKDGRWMAGVVDTDRIARFGQVSSERLGFYLPAPMAGPLVRVNSGVPRTATSAHDYMAKALEYKGWIRYQNGQFVPGRLDPEIVRSKFTLTADVPAR